MGAGAIHREGLNPDQLDAVVHGNGPLLIVAGAGSGKTRVLTHRIAHLIDEHGVHPMSILAITFTNKAAGEMKERVAKLIGPVAQKMWVSTFHSACVASLSRGRVHRLSIELLDLRPVRRRTAHRLRHSGSVTRRQEVHAPRRALADQQGQERPDLPRCAA